MGTPTQMYNEQGEQVWEQQLDTNGKPIYTKENGITCDIRFQGQYYDKDVELCYNRFRWYDDVDGRYISKDPIGLASGEFNFYSYVEDSNGWVDVFGLKKYLIYQASELDENGKPTSEIYTGRTRGDDNKSNKSILNKRKSSHHRNLGEMVVVHETDDYKSHRGAEHHFINEQRKKGNASDQINAISERNFGKNGKKKKGDLYMEAFNNERKKRQTYGKN